MPNSISNSKYSGKQLTTSYSPSHNYASRNKCDAQYAQVMAMITSGNAGNSSVVGTAQYLYNQCLSNAGF